MQLFRQPRRALYIEGSEEYSAIRAQVEAGGRRAKRGPKAEKEEAPKPAPAPVPAPKPRKDGEVRDPNFQQILDAVRIGRNVYLWGPAGSGKSTIAKQVAEELGLPFYCKGTCYDKYEFEGQQDPQQKNGYIPSTFFKAYSEGGVYCADELDSWAEDSRIALNGALSAPYIYNFPVIGDVKMHPNFRFIGTGNTNGFGPTEMYPTRTDFGNSFRDRFHDFIYIDYNKTVEVSAASRNMEVVKFVRDLRKVLDDIKCGEVVCGYRMLKNVAEAVAHNEILGRALYNARQAVEFSVMRGINGDLVRMIASKIKDSDNQFTAALKEYASVAI